MGKNYCKVEKKWCKLLKRDICAQCNKKIDEVDRCPRLKEIETTRFIDILKRVQFEPVFETLCKWYEDQEKSKNGYREVFEKLLQMTPKKHELSDLFIRVRKTKDLFDEGSDKVYLDTDGVNMQNGKQYGIEFVPWHDWISMYITSESLATLTNEEIVASCLFEMTFFGFDEKEIREEVDKMKNSVEECKKEINAKK